ncbi:acyl-CoA dehydrogenase family protein [Amycolatopsis sp. NPDC005003]
MITGTADRPPIDLGDFFAEDNPCGLHALNDRFDRRVYPGEVEDAALRSGFDKYVVPQALGGRLTDPGDLFAMARRISQRSITPAIKYGSSLLGANPVWLWGSDEQQALVASRLLNGGVTSFAVSERDAGSDLRATATGYRVTGDGGIELRGEKWPIGNAARSTVCTTLACSDRGKLSLLLVDRAAGGAISTGEPAVCLGLWGHDLGGIRFEGRVPATVVGPESIGVAQVLKTLQVTRTVISGLSLGCLDSALAIAVKYADRRRLYGQPISALPEVREEILAMALDAALGELFAHVSLRSLVLRPQSFALWSSITKAGVPHLAEGGIRGAQRVLGARSFLDTPYARRLHQISTEHDIAGIFEGTSHVNLRNLLDQAGTELQPHDPEALVPLMSLDGPPLVWQPSGRDLRVTSLGDNPILAGLVHGLETGTTPIDLCRAEANALLEHLARVRQGARSSATGYALVWLHLLGAVCGFLTVNADVLTSCQKDIAELAAIRALHLLGVRSTYPDVLAGRVIDLVLQENRAGWPAISMLTEKA